MRGVREWLQVDLGRLHVVTGVQTQGRFGNGQGQEYVEEYKLEYWRPGMERWAKYRRRSGTEVRPSRLDIYLFIRLVQPQKRNTHTHTHAQTREYPFLLLSPVVSS